MNRSTTRRSAIALVVCAATVATLQGALSPAAGAATRSEASAARPASAVAHLENATARQFAASLADPAWRAQVRTAALGTKNVDLHALTGRAAAPAGLASAVTRADHGVAAAKGLDAGIGSLLQLRLGADSMRSQLNGATPWVAAAVPGHQAGTVTAYDAQGRTHVLSTKSAPNRPVYVIDINVDKAASVGMGVVEKAFTKAGLTTPQKVQPHADGYQSTKIDSIYLNDDEETWIEGDAEIYSLVSGFGHDGNVRVDPVQMPYLDNDHTTYYPNQILVNWSNYKYNEADVVMMEDDGDTNYAALAKAIADALLTITDNGAYVPLVDAILAAIPTSWWTNDPDYTESWYTMSTTSSGRLNGARGNGWMTVEPYWVPAL